MDIERLARLTILAICLIPAMVCYAIIQGDTITIALALAGLIVYRCITI